MLHNKLLFSYLYDLSDKSTQTTVSDQNKTKQPWSDAFLFTKYIIKYLSRKSTAHAWWLNSSFLLRPTHKAKRATFSTEQRELQSWKKHWCWPCCCGWLPHNVHSDWCLTGDHPPPACHCHVAGSLCFAATLRFPLWISSLSLGFQSLLCLVKGHCNIWGDNVPDVLWDCLSFYICNTCHLPVKRTVLIKLQ